jgi:hypothetical protein
LDVRLLGMMFGGTIAKVMNMVGIDLIEVIASILRSEYLAHLRHTCMVNKRKRHYD